MDTNDVNRIYIERDVEATEVLSNVRGLVRKATDEGRMLGSLGASDIAQPSVEQDEPATAEEKPRNEQLGDMMSQMLGGITGAAARKKEGEG